MPCRLLHLSDLHVGAHDEGRAGIERAVRDLVERERPELVIVSGDLTNRNRPDQHGRAATFLRSLERPLVVVPGNHDLPSLPPARLVTPFARFVRAWGDVEPVYRSDDTLVCAINSVRPWKYQRGAVSAAQLARVRAALSEAHAGALRVVVLHHHLATPPWRTGKRTVPRRSAVLAALGEAGAELVIAGHTHQSLVVERREFQFAGGGVPGVVLAVAPGLGRPRPRRHAEASGLHVYDAVDGELRVETYAWDGQALRLIARRGFPRG